MTHFSLKDRSPPQSALPEGYPLLKRTLREPLKAMAYAHKELLLIVTSCGNRERG